jgi:hypothetical protein
MLSNTQQYFFHRFKIGCVSRKRLMRNTTLDTSRKLAPLLRQAFRQGIEAASRGEDRNPYVPNSHLYHAWMAGWASLARAWNNNDDLRWA